MKPLMMKMNRPSDKNVTGKVSRISKGRISALTSPSTAAASSAVQPLLIVTECIR
ncbi:hypothetical protein D3C72_1349040 [compost metagenome]